MIRTCFKLGTFILLQDFAFSFHFYNLPQLSNFMLFLFSFSFLFFIFKLVSIIIFISYLINSCILKFCQSNLNSFRQALLKCFSHFFFKHGHKPIQFNLHFFRVFTLSLFLAFYVILRNNLKFLFYFNFIFFVYC